MTQAEVMKLLYVIKASYPRHFSGMSIQDTQNMANAWGMLLGDLDYAQASAGLKTYITTDTKGFPPAPGQIIACIQKAAANPAREQSAAEAWDEVYRAIENLRWDEPEREFDRLPKKTQKIIGSPAALREIAMMDIGSVMIGEKARFFRQFEAMTEREKDYARIPERIRREVEALIEDDNSRGRDGSLLSLLEGGQDGSPSLPAWDPEEEG